MGTKDTADMVFLEHRLKSFRKWPITGDDAVCTPDKMASAGFYHSPSSTSPDAVTCAFCQKVLDEWEPKDDPRQEHLNHSADCAFLQLNKEESQWTVHDFCRLVAVRHASLQRIKLLKMAKVVEDRADAIEREMAMFAAVAERMKEQQ